MSNTTKPRRRFASRSSHSLALGGLAAASVGLAGCEPAPPEDVKFTSVQECVSSGFGQEFCDTQYQRALAAHAENAPKFDSRAACEAEWGVGDCRPQATSSGGSVFMPFMAGYLLSSAMQSAYYRNDRDYWYGGGSLSGGRYTGTPIYRSRTGGDVTITKSAPGKPAAVKPVNINTRTAARSGFGGRGIGRGGFGG